MYEGIKLSPKQQEAVEAEGPVLVTGPAGSGKTETILQRIYQRRERFFVLTHTRISRDNIEYQLAQNTEYSGYRVYNIHAACLREILRWKGEYSKIRGTAKSVDMIEVALKRKNLDNRYDPYSVYCYIKFLKNYPHLQTPFILKGNMIIDLSPEFTNIHEKLSQTEDINLFVEAMRWPSDWFQVLTEAIQQYQHELVLDESIDLDDMLLAAYLKIVEHQHRETSKYRSNLLYDMDDRTVYVEDIQDFNWMQYEVFKQYQKEAKCVYIASDPNYRINDFRSGGDTTSIFMESNPNLKIVQLGPLSHRSTYKIVRISEFFQDESFDYQQYIGGYPEDNVPYVQLNQFIDESKGLRYLIPPSAEYNPIAILETENEWEEYEKLAIFIRFVLGLSEDEEGAQKRLYQPQDVLLLYPKYSQGKELEDTLNDRDIPSSLIGGYQEGDEEKENPFSKDTVKITSLYKSKGIEAKIVIIIGLEDPDSEHPMAYRDGQVNAMLHIGINRAREFALLCWTGYRDGGTYTDKKMLDQLQSSWVQAIQAEFKNLRKKNADTKGRLRKTNKRYRLLKERIQSLASELNDDERGI